MGSCFSRKLYKAENSFDRIKESKENGSHVPTSSLAGEFSAMEVFEAVVRDITHGFFLFPTYFSRIS